MQHDISGIMIGFGLGLVAAFMLSLRATRHPGFGIPTSSGLRLRSYLLWLLPTRRYFVVAMDCDYFKAVNSAGGYRLANRLVNILMQQLRGGDVILQGQGQEGDELIIIGRYRPGAAAAVARRAQQIARDLPLSDEERAAILHHTNGASDRLGLTLAALDIPVPVWHLAATREMLMQAVLTTKTAGNRGVCVLCDSPAA